MAENEHDKEHDPDDEPVEPVAEEVIPEIDDGGDEDEESSASLVRYDPLQRYLAEIRRYPLLTREEEHELGVRYRESEDVEAAYRLVTANLRLVVMIARKYQHAFRNLLDIIQEGNMGLMEAVKNFDPYRGIRFPSYAVWWIRAYVIRYVMNNWRMVKLGTTQAQRKLFFNLQKEKERLEREGFVAEPKLIAQNLDVKESEVVEMQKRLSGRDLSVDTPLDDDSSSTILDTLAGKGGTTEERFGNEESRDLLARKIREFGETLTGKDKVIFDSRLMAEEPLTLQDIGDQYGVSRERVRQIEERIKKKLKAFLLSEFSDLEDAVIDIIQ